MSLLLTFIFLFTPFQPEYHPVEPIDSTVNTEQLWKECGLEKVLSLDLFKMAMNGYIQIDQIKNKKILTIIDYTKPSAEKRFYVINLEQKALLYQSLVAHGKNSGEYYAKNFSNQNRSLKSCLGFFVTAETYQGKYGLSLRLDGLEEGFNDNARKRAIVIHGADYVSQEYAKMYGRLGKSWGCPALPLNLNKKIIDVIAHGSCLFIYAKDENYLKNSRFIQQSSEKPLMSIR